MPVSRSESRNDVADAQLECQQELEALERQYRKMKNEKKSYRVETDNILRRQECEIEKLAKEHENIEALLNVSVSRYNKDFDKGNVKKLNNLLEKDTFIQQASFEGIHALVTIDKRITATKEEVLKKQLFCMNAQPLDQFAIQRHTRIMENRVYNANMRFNKTLTKNAKLKATIDYISVQKMRFRELYRRMKREFRNGKTEIDNVVESSLSYFHARDEAQHRMAFLREKAERDLSLYNMELKDVMRIIDHDRKLRNFMNTKTEDRSSILEQAIYKRQNKRMTNLLGNLKVEASKYEEIFSKIRAVTGIHDIDQLVSRFIKIEDENFAQFNYVNEINTEIEALQEETRERKVDMADMEKTSTQIDKRRREILSQLEVRFSDVCAKRQKEQEQYKQAKKILEQVKPKIDHLFKSVKCNRSAITDLLGNTAGLTEDNVMSFLGIVEQRTNELLQVHCIQKLKYGLDDAGKHLTVVDTMFPTAAERFPPLSIKPPSIADDDDIGGPISDLSDSRPVSFKEAKALVNKGVVCVREVAKEPKKQIRSAV